MYIWGRMKCGVVVRLERVVSNLYHVLDTTILNKYV